MTDTTASGPGSGSGYVEGQPARFVVSERFGDSLLLRGDRGDDLMAVFLTVPPPNQGGHMSSVVVGEPVELNVLRVFATGHLIVSSPGGATYFATPVCGSQPAP